jgi:hypothetical protein
MLVATWMLMAAAVAPSGGQQASAASEDQPAAVVQASAASAAADGLFLPTTLAPRVGSNAAFGSALAGYDGARGKPLVGLTAEVRLLGPVALRAEVAYAGEGGGGARPSVGLRAQLLRQAAHGVDGALSVFYRPEGFTEPEGEIETFASLARRFERVSIVGNLVYGQDPEGNERDGEVRAALLHHGLGPRLLLGFDSRVRFAIGAQHVAASKAEPRFDLLAGPIATVVAGPVALFAEAGPSLLKLGAETQKGVVALGGVGTAF